MNGLDVRALMVLSVRDPARAARLLIDMRLPTGMLWQGLFLAAALNAILFTLTNMLVPPPMPLPGILASPLWYLGFVAGGLALSVLVIFQAGRMLGGVASLADILVLMVWLQALRLMVQAVSLVLMLAAPGLAAMLAIAAGLVGVYILAKFVNEAHGFNSLGRSALVLLASVLAMAVAMTVVMAFTGAPISDFSGY